VGANRAGSPQSDACGARNCLGINSAVMKHVANNAPDFDFEGLRYWLLSKKAAICAASAAVTLISGMAVPG
jgi:hypothetical protein